MAAASCSHMWLHLMRQAKFSRVSRVRSLSTSTRTYETYSMAIARDVPETLPQALTKFSATSINGIDVAVARRQHDRYLECLRRVVPTYVLPALDDHPDSVFVEDTVVAIGRKAVITNPGHPSRRGEVDTIREVLLRLGYEIIDMRNDPEIRCDGGDILYSGRHLFVGLSERTNEDAARLLADTFGDVETISVPFEGDALHLKSVVSHMDSNTLLAPTGPLGDAVLKAMGAEERSYSQIRLPDMLACNVVSVNGTILAQDNGCTESRQILMNAAAQRRLDLVMTDSSEFAKCDGALTCCSVLLQI